MAGMSMTHEFVVTDFLDTEFLLGMDFLHEHKITLDIGNRTLISPRGNSPFYNKPTNIEKTSKIRSKKTITIPPNTRRFIRGQLLRSPTTLRV